jgi:hypothetical protein
MRSNDWFYQTKLRQRDWYRFRLGIILYVFHMTEQSFSMLWLVNRLPHCSIRLVNYEFID